MFFSTRVSQFLGLDGVALKFILKKGEDFIEGVDEFFLIGIADLIEMADDPAFFFKCGGVGDAQKFVVGGEVGDEGELAATDEAVFPFAGVWTEAGEGDHAAGHFVFVEGLFAAFVAAIGMPKVAGELDGCPFAFVGGWDGFADVAAEGFA